MSRLVLISMMLLVVVADAWAQDVTLPEDPLHGRILFETRGCIDCHALGGYGGTLGPDLARDLYYGSFLSLIAAIWNHIPDMNRQYRLQHTRRPVFTESEILDLAGFIYYLRYLGEPGSVSRGQRLLAEKHCTQCHGGGGASPFDVMPGDRSPQSMVQSMWNHGPEMQEGISDLGLTFPTLDGRDLGDISTYLQMVASHPQGGGVSTGNPVLGRTLFTEKQCATCHRAAPSEGDYLGPALSEMDLQRNVLEIAALMWNHGPQMRDYMERERIDWPRFEQGEMADVIAYLYWLGFQDPPGRPNKGSTVFDEKGCADCHTSGDDSLGPDLTTVRHLQRPGRLAQLMWNHAGDMEDLMLARNRSWPLLTDQELRDLLAFLGSERSGR